MESPLAWIEQQTLNASDTVTFHVENNETVTPCITLMRSRSMRVSIALSPATPFSSLKPYVHDVDEVMLMSVIPGNSGQTFIPTTYNRIFELQKLRALMNASFEISLDGGITRDVLMRCIPYSITRAAIGAALFTHPDIAAAYRMLLK
jgi:ribulose-phosphate 3-epimerase